MSNNIKDNKVSLSLSDNDNIKISEALSFIRNKLQGRLKNISVINDRTAVVIYGKHKDRLMIDLKDNNYYENLEEKLEALKAENNNLLVNSVIYPIKNDTPEYFRYNSMILFGFRKYSVNFFGIVTG
ncbi:unnamed protein product [Rhizophagus irregularis]|nr:unnamed protein product [Rhizophagus irregularis]